MRYAAHEDRDSEGGDGEWREVEEEVGDFWEVVAEEHADKEEGAAGEDD